MTYNFFGLELPKNKTDLYKQYKFSDGNLEYKYIQTILQFYFIETKLDNEATHYRCDSNDILRLYKIKADLIKRFGILMVFLERQYGYFLKYYITPYNEDKQNNKMYKYDREKEMEKQELNKIINEEKDNGDQEKITKEENDKNVIFDKIPPIDNINDLFSKIDLNNLIINNMPVIKQDSISSNIINNSTINIPGNNNVTNSNIYNNNYNINITIVSAGLYKSNKKQIKDCDLNEINSDIVIPKQKQINAPKDCDFGITNSGIMRPTQKQIKNVSSFERICKSYAQSCKDLKYENCINLKSMLDLLTSNDNGKLQDIIGCFYKSIFIKRLTEYTKICENYTIYETKYHYYNKRNRELLLFVKDIPPIYYKQTNKIFIEHTNKKNDEYNQQNIIIEKSNNTSGESESNIKKIDNTIENVNDKTDADDCLKNKTDTLEKNILSKEKVKKAVWNKWCGSTDIGKCFCCDKEINKSSVTKEYGHIIPDSKGGPYTIDNIRPICADCNRGKGGMHREHMFGYMIRNNLPGLKHLSKDEKYLYLYDETEKLKMYNNCKDKLGILVQDKIISESCAAELLEIIDVKRQGDYKYQLTVKYILKLK